MPRRMSCSLTTDAVRSRTKTVTRRRIDTWRNLKPGDRLTLVEQAMGLPKGAKQVVLAEVEVIAVDVMPLGAISPNEVEREGFGPPMRFTGRDFIVFWLGSHGYNAKTTDPNNVLVRRIAWKYLPTEEQQ